MGCSGSPAAYGATRHDLSRIRYPATVARSDRQDADDHDTDRHDADRHEARAHQDEATDPRGSDMPDAARADVVALGHRALGRLGARVGWLYLTATAVAIVVGGWSASASQSGRRDLAAALATAAVVLGCGVVLQRGTPADARPHARLAALAAAAVASGATALLGTHLDWHGTQYAASVAVTAGGTALALAAGTWWGAASCVVSLAVAAAVLARAGDDLGIVSGVGSAVSTAVAVSVTNVLHRGFADTERALAGADAAALAHRVSRERWRTRRRTDRQLHDTVLTTLNLLTHEEFGTSHDMLRELAERDRRLLEGDDAALLGLAMAETPPSGVPVPGPPGTTPPEGVPADDDPVTGPLVRRWASTGLAVHLHGARWRDATSELPPDAEQALLDATAECLSNVHRHAGVAEVNVVVMREPGVVSVLVVDAGRGFDTAAVEADRLGLADSVRGRLAEVKGDVVLWSVPGEGTSVMLSVPGAGS
jgi:signal transduction histidine kinase